MRPLGAEADRLGRPLPLLPVGEGPGRRRGGIAVTSPASNWRYHIRVSAIGRDERKITDDIKRTSGVNVGSKYFSFPTAAERDRVLAQIRSRYGAQSVTPEDG